MANSQNKAQDLPLLALENGAECAGRVLIVEDEPEILEPLAHSLHKTGFSVLRAEDGLTACRVIGIEKPDLILLDIMLPDLDGWEVCKLLRQHPDKCVASIPVIMLTALNSPQDKYHGLELGADAFLPKPYSIREVILHATNLIKRRQETVVLKNRLKSMSDHEQQTTNLQRLLFHELRNQLMILNGYSELLNRTPDENRAQTCRDAIYRSANYLQTLAEEVLLIRQVEDGQLALKMEPFCIDQLIDEVIRVYNAPAKEKCMQLIHHKDLEKSLVTLNRTALKIILSSLIDNSIKFGSSGQKIKITFTHSSKDVELTVSDQGPGIPVEDLPHIFEPYFRSIQHENSIRGTGIGLHAVCVLAKAMGGHVTAENMPNQGTCFRINLPHHSTESK